MNMHQGLITVFGCEMTKHMNNVTVCPALLTQRTIPVKYVVNRLASYSELKVAKESIQLSTYMYVHIQCTVHT